MPSLPHTFRPFGVRMAVFVFGGMLVLVTAVIWFTFPDDIRAKFTTFQRGTVIVLGLAFLALGWGLARCRVEARVEGLRVVNGYRSRRLEWSEVLAVTMKPGSPWAVLDLSDGTTAQALDQVAAWLDSPSLELLVERFDHWEHLRVLVDEGDARGGRVHDARVAAICLAHGVTTLLTADRDFGRFPRLRVANPLVG